MSLATKIRLYKKLFAFKYPFDINYSYKLGVFNESVAISRDQSRRHFYKTGAKSAVKCQKSDCGVAAMDKSCYSNFNIVVCLDTVGLGTQGK